jgi:hypothetical protein
VAVLASASGVRIECDECAEHINSPDLTIEELRRVAGYIRVDDRDCCPNCAAALIGEDR